MSEQLFEIYIGSRMVASSVPLEMLGDFVQAIFEKYYSDYLMEVIITRMAPKEGQNNDT